MYKYPFRKYIDLRERKRRKKMLLMRNNKLTSNYVNGSNMGG